MHEKHLLVQLATVPVTLWSFFHGQASYMRKRGLDVTAVSSPDEVLDRFGNREGIEVHGVEMQRAISPHRDIVALFELRRLFRRLRPTIVHSHTPKGGLLGTLAARLSGVPVCIYHIHGLRYMGAQGLSRWVLKSMEWVACRFAHKVLCVSPSIVEQAVQDRVCPRRKISTLLGGSYNGVDAANRFNPDMVPADTREGVRRDLGIPMDAPVVGFVGRVVRDKGIVELSTAWTRLREEFPTAHLLIVGPLEPHEPLPPDVEAALREGSRLHMLGEREDTPSLYSAMNNLVLPTYREGLGMTLLEAAAMELPVVATRIPGCVDAVEDGVTGTLVPVRDAKALAEAIRRYLLDPELRKQHGKAGRERVLREFRQEAIWEALYQEYCRLLRERGLPLPQPVEQPACAE
ncbi:MAG: glycosyltransferase family 4 protein [Planctomycetota bacterium]